MSNADILSTASMSAYYLELAEQGAIPLVSEVTQEAIFDAAHFALTATVPEQLACGCIKTHGLFSPAVSLQTRAQIAVEGLLAMYETHLDLDDPERYLAFVNNREFLPAMIAVGSLTAAIEERGRLMREAGQPPPAAT